MEIPARLPKKPAGFFIDGKDAKRSYAPKPGLLQKIQEKEKSKKRAASSTAVSEAIDDGDTNVGLLECQAVDTESQGGGMGNPLRLPAKPFDFVHIGKRLKMSTSIPEVGEDGICDRPSLSIPEARPMVSLSATVGAGSHDIGATRNKAEKAPPLRLQPPKRQKTSASLSESRARDADCISRLLNASL